MFVATSPSFPSPRFPRRRLLLLASAALVIVAACDGDPDPGDDAGATDGHAGETELQVGGADKVGRKFVSLTSGTEKMPILRGPQGGQHIWVMVRYRGAGLWHKKMRIAVTMTIDETKKVVKPGTVTLTQSLVEKDGWYTLKTAIPAFVKCPCQIVGKKLTVEAAVIDLYGRTAIATEKVTGTWDGVCSGDPPGSCAAQ